MSKFLLSCVVAFAAAGLFPSTLTEASSHLSPVTSANIVSELSATSQFISFKSKFNREYSSDEEEEFRYTVFQQNLIKFQRLNQLNGSPAFGINQFSDLSEKEFAARYLGYVPQTGAEAVRRLDWSVATPVNGKHNHHLRNAAVVDASTPFDWRSKGAVTPVKDQGQCGSCWAFSATEAVESAWFLAGKGLLELAPQQLVSCDTVDQGCGGGDTPTAYKYLQGTGMELETDEPYTSGLTGVNGVCAFDATKVVAKISNFTYATTPCYDTCTTQDETLLANNIIAHGPASICVNAASWQGYVAGGIVDAAACGGSAYTDLDHCVMLTGVNVTSDGTAIWNVRNSWADTWGNDGYIWVKQGQNACGIADEATFVTI